MAFPILGGIFRGRFVRLLGLVSHCCTVIKGDKTTSKTTRRLPGIDGCKPEGLTGYFANVFLLLMASAAVAAEPPAPGHQAPQPPLEAGSYPYQLFLPNGYAADSRERWPLLIFLHGSGERGADIEQVKVNGPPKMLVDRPGFAFVTVSPQLPDDGSRYWNVRTLDRMLDLLGRRLNVDPNRIYLTGLSLGGYATWDWAVMRPDRFAAIAPVAGRGDMTAACKLKALPIWVFHGDSDPVVPIEGDFDMVQSVRRCGGQPRLTVYPDTGHDSWSAAYNDPALYVWMLGHRRPDAVRK